MRTERAKRAYEALTTAAHIVAVPWHGLTLIVATPDEIAAASYFIALKG